VLAATSTAAAIQYAKTSPELSETRPAPSVRRTLFVSQKRAAACSASFHASTPASTVNRVASSTSRLEYPHSLSYHATTFT